MNRLNGNWSERRKLHNGERDRPQRPVPLQSELKYFFVAWNRFYLNKLVIMRIIIITKQILTISDKITASTYCNHIIESLLEWSVNVLSIIGLTFYNATQVVGLVKNANINAFTIPLGAKSAKPNFHT